MRQIVEAAVLVSLLASAVTVIFEEPGYVALICAIASLILFTFWERIYNRRSRR